MNPRRRAILVAGFSIGCGLPWRFAAGALTQPSRIEVMRFSAGRAGGPLPASIEPWAFADQPRHTRYSLVEDEGRVVLRAQAEASTSGLVRPIRVSPRTHPILVWRWKAANLVQHGDLAKKEGDDFALRVYVTFDVDPDTLPAGDRLKLSFARMLYGDRVPRAALCYVWDARAPRGMMRPNPYSDRVRMIVAESGTEHVGRWVQNERNVMEDYRLAFGTTTVPDVNGVIVSTDTDNTGETVEAYYGDIEFRSGSAVMR